MDLPIAIKTSSSLLYSMIRSLRLGNTLGRCSRLLSTSTTTPTFLEKEDLAAFNLFNPTEEHAHLRQMLRTFVMNEVEPQALEFNRKELFNVKLFRKLGDLGLLGITVDPDYGGSGMDAIAAVIAHEEVWHIWFAFVLMCKACWF